MSSLPRSIPITWPLTFSSPSSDRFLMKGEAIRERKAGERVKADVARGNWKRQD